MPASGQPNLTFSLIRRLDTVARATFPATSTALVLVLTATPVGLPALGPALTLACVFFWSVFRPTVMPAPVAFGLGFLQDVLEFAPLGQGVLVLLLLHVTVLRLRRFLFRRSFSVVWLVFCTLALLAATLSYVLQIVLGWRIVPFTPALVQVGLTAGVYPAVAALLTRMHEKMQQAEALA